MPLFLGGHSMGGLIATLVALGGGEGENSPPPSSSTTAAAATATGAAAAAAGAAAAASGPPPALPRLSGLLEPRAAAPAKRLAALGKLAEAGVPAIPRCRLTRLSWFT